MSRMAAQWRFYGSIAADGGYLGATIDDATPTSLRLVRVNRPLGPVVVFGASNSPFGFGVLGNDTGSALAAGCPVIAKAHPRTSSRVSGSPRSPSAPWPRPGPQTGPSHLVHE